MFDLARPETFEGALSWLSDVTEKLFDEKKELAAEAAVASASSRGRNRSASSRFAIFGTSFFPVHVVDFVNIILASGGRKLFVCIDMQS